MGDAKVTHLTGIISGVLQHDFQETQDGRVESQG